MKKPAFPTAIFFLIVIVIGCHKQKLPDVGQDYILKRALSIYLRDSLTNQILIGKSGEKFMADTVKVFENRSGSMSAVGQAIKDSLGQYVCNFIYLYAIASKEEDILPISINNEFFVYLNQYDTDTVKVIKQPFGNISFYWNNRPIESISALNTKFPYPIAAKK